ncbi:hypothetical protein SNE40_000732 [Patella caerulea]|uniref:Uncharacterized protein n=1 Tax=Patella caerulea TaxID=87958 RepID=A0AAN8KB34_PATCE
MRREDENEPNFEIPVGIMNLPPMVTRGLKIRRFDQQSHCFELEGSMVPEDRKRWLKSSLNGTPNNLRPLMPRSPGKKKIVSNIRALTEGKSSDSLPPLLGPTNRILHQIRSRSVSIKPATTPVLKRLRTSLVQFPKINFPSTYTRVDVSATLESPEKAPCNFSLVPPSTHKPTHRRSLFNERQHLTRIVDFKFNSCIQQI